MISYENYADDLALFVNTPALAESLLHSLEQAAGGIGHYMNLNKTEYICFKQKRSGKPLKLVGQFIYLGSNISSTESDVNICLAKAWNAIDRLSVIWKVNVSNKTRFLPSYSCVHTTIWMLTKWMDTNKMHREKARWELWKNAACCLGQILKAVPYKTLAVQPPASYLINYSKRWIRHTEHSCRNKDKLISDVLM